MIRRSGERTRSARARVLMAAMLSVGLVTGAFVAAAGDGHTSTEAVLTALDRAPQKEAVQELVARARAALDRAAKLRMAGDEAHAKIADRVARDWAEAARIAMRAAAVEASAAAARASATDAGTLADRERALLEEAIAQSGRLRAQIAATERGDGGLPARTSAAATAPAGTKDSGSPAAPKAIDGGAR